MPYIDINQPWIYMCPPSWTHLPPPSRSSFKHKERRDFTGGPVVKTLPSNMGSAVWELRSHLPLGATKNISKRKWKQAKTPVTFCRKKMCYYVLLKIPLTAHLSSRGSLFENTRCILIYSIHTYNIFNKNKWMLEMKSCVDDGLTLDLNQKEKNPVPSAFIRLGYWNQHVKVLAHLTPRGFGGFGVT